MTREEALALYHPIRASVQRILSAAISAGNQSDFVRAAKQLGLWVEGTIALPEGDHAAEMFRMFARSTQFISTRTRPIRLARFRRFERPSSFQQPAMRNHRD
jgi:hypothetical protein